MTLWSSASGWWSPTAILHTLAIFCTLCRSSSLSAILSTYRAASFVSAPRNHSWYELHIPCHLKVSLLASLPKIHDSRYPHKGTSKIFKAGEALTGTWKLNLDIRRSFCDSKGGICSLLDVPTCCQTVVTVMNWICSGEFKLYGYGPESGSDSVKGRSFFWNCVSRAFKKWTFQRRSEGPINLSIPASAAKSQQKF